MALQITDFDNAVTDLDFIDEIKTSVNDTLVSRLGNDTFSRIGRLKQNKYIKANASGAWTSGVTFNNYEQYLVYNDEVFVLDINAIPPVVTGATPDSSFIRMLSITDIMSGVFDDYNSEFLHNYTTLAFKDQQDLEDLINLEGISVEVEAGDSVQVTDTLDKFVPYVIIDFADIQPGDITILLSNGLYAKEINYSLDPAERNPLFNLDKDNDGQNFREPSFTFNGNLGFPRGGTLDDSSIGQDGRLITRNVSNNTGYRLLNSDGYTLNYVSKNDSTFTCTPYGGAVGIDGRYFTLSNDPDDGEVLAINFSTGEEEIINFTPFVGFNVYCKAVTCDNGLIYQAIQKAGEVAMVKIDPENSTAEIVGYTLIGSSLLFSRCCITKEGNIMLAINEDEYFYEFNTTTESFNIVTGTPYSGVTSISRFSNILLGKDGFIYAIPNFEDNIVKIDSSTLTVVDDNVATIPPASTGGAKIFASCTAGNGLIYMVQGGNNTRFISFDPDTTEIKEYEDLEDNLTFSVGGMGVDDKGRILVHGQQGGAIISNLKSIKWTQSVYVAQ